MKIKHVSSLALLLALFALSLNAHAQTGNRDAATGASKTSNAKATAAARTVPLPASDAVLVADVRRLLTEAVPRALEGDRERLASIEADIEQFKTRTGIDPRAFDTVAVGARLQSTSSRAVKVDHVVAIARGRYEAESVVAAARAVAKGGHAEEKRAGVAIHVFRLDEQVKLFGLLKMRVGELAIAALDAGTLAVGEPAAVRAAVDVHTGKAKTIDPVLFDAAKLGDDDLVAFAGNVPPSAFAGLDVGLPEVNRSISSIRAFHGSIATTAGGFAVTTVLRTNSAAEAKQLTTTVEALRAVAPGLISVAGERARFAKSAIENLKVATRGSDVELRSEMAQTDLAALLRVL